MNSNLTDELYAETLARVSDGHASGTISLLRLCDGSGPCAVELRHHKHWRGGVSVSAVDVISRLITERDAALAEAERLAAALAAAQANTDYIWCEKHDWEDLQPCPDCDTGSE